MNDPLNDLMMKMVKENPNRFIKFLEDNRIDFDKVRGELDLARKIVKDRFKMAEKEIHAVEFVFWFSYFVEREAQDLTVEPEVHIGGRREFIQLLVDKLHFGDKISIISDLYSKDHKKDAFVSLMWKVNTLRNHVAHGRFGDLKYDGFELSDSRGQLKIVADLMNALLKE